MGRAGGAHGTPAQASAAAYGPEAYPWQAHGRRLVSQLVLRAATDAALDALDRALGGGRGRA